MQFLDSTALSISAEVLGISYVYAFSAKEKKCYVLSNITHIGRFGPK